MRSEEIKDLALALSKFQGQVQDAQESRENTFLGYKYAVLADALKAVRKLLSEHELSLVQLPVEAATPGNVCVETILMHSSGQWISCRMEAPAVPSKGTTTVQAMGSAITYLRRYSLSALLGIAATDDDGQSAGRRDQNGQGQQGQQGQGNGGNPAPEQGHQGHQGQDDTEPQYIDAAQVDNLRQLIKLSDADLERFLSFCKCVSLEQMPAEKYERALTTLQARLEKKRAREKAQADAQAKADAEQGGAA